MFSRLLNNDKWFINSYFSSNENPTGVVTNVLCNITDNTYVVGYQGFTFLVCYRWCLRLLDVGISAPFLHVVFSYYFLYWRRILLPHVKEWYIFICVVNEDRERLLQKVRVGASLPATNYPDTNPQTQVVLAACYSDFLIPVFIVFNASPPNI